MSRIILASSIGLGLVGLATAGIIYANTSKTPINSNPIAETSPIPTIQVEVTPSATPSATPKTSKNVTTSPTPTQKVTPTSTPTTTSTVSSNSQTTSTTSTNPTSTPVPTNAPTSTPRPTSVPNTSGTITVSSTNVITTIDAHGAGDGLVYGSAITITSEGANGISLKINGGTQGQGFDISSVGMIPGSSVTTRAYVNANKGNGTYKGSVTIMYSKNSQNYDGPTVNYEITLTNAADRSGTIEVSTNAVNVTISRNGAGPGQILEGAGFVITGKGASAYQISYNQPTQGYGFMGSGGLSLGTTSNIPSFINSSTPNGTYTGSVTVKYTKNGTESSGPVVSYSITLTD